MVDDAVAGVSSFAVDDDDDDDDVVTAGEVMTQLTRTDHSQTVRTRSNECPRGHRRVDPTPDEHSMYCLGRG